MAPIPPTSARILAVDDDEANLRVLRRLLLRAGFPDVATTSDPTAVQALVAEMQPDLLLLDLNMPEMDGLTVLRRMRAAFGPDLPRVIVLSGECPDASVPLVLGAGAQAFVSKPFDADDLVGRVREVLARDAAPQPAAEGQPRSRR
ncbi:MAG: response regulator receiver modulated diguanylate phosphodiesterase [Gemmatimonadetes bacterium]|nr:response regulator receiver modulated diguanylate phosphodiesterase [Gemmatimonadota bacterium]